MVVAWLCLPFSVPIFIAPLVVCFMAASMWLWVGHLQKRL
jgi:ABC-type transport system involved in cytochrome c biogenesis permease subunit